MTIALNRKNFKVKDQIKDLPLNVRMARSPVLSYSDNNSRGIFEPPEYDLTILNTIEDVESYVRQANRKKVSLAFKEGWDVVGKNPETVSYIKTRLNQIEFAQNKPWRLLLKEVFYDLVSKSNSYLVKVRNSEISGGFEREANGKILQPVAAYFIMAPETVEISKDKTGKIDKYRQVLPSGKKKEFKAEDVVHFHIDKKTGFSIGTPILQPVIDDIKTLRRIEENIDLLVYQNLFPLFQYVVGTESLPAQNYPDGTSEVDLVKTELEYMPPEGILVTPERHEIKMIGSEGRALRAEGYLNHFKQRVFSGIGVSAVDMGEGSTSNRSTADTLSDNIRDDVKSIQDDLEGQFDFYILRELLLEGKFKDLSVLDDLNIVRLQFREIDKEAKIALENHVAQMFSQHLLNEDEARIAIGLDPKNIEDEDFRKKTYWKLIQEPAALIQAVDEAYLAPAAVENPQVGLSQGNIEEGKSLIKAENIGKRPANAQTRGQKAGASQNNPSNQYGNRGSPKLSKDNVIQQSLDELLNDISAYKNHEVSDDYLNKIILAWKIKLSEKIKRTNHLSFYEGFREIGLDPFSYNLIGPISTVDSNTQKYLDKLANNISDRLSLISKDTVVSEIMPILEITNNRAKAIYESQKQRAYNYGRLVAFRLLDENVTYSDTGCEVCKSLNVTSKRALELDIEEIPPHHPFCECKVKKA